jgi:hypothetical protein
MYAATKKAAKAMNPHVCESDALKGLGVDEAVASSGNVLFAAVSA